MRPEPAWFTIQNDHTASIGRRDEQRFGRLHFMKNSLLVVACFFCVGVSIAQESPTAASKIATSGIRVWHDQSGFFSLRAELVRIERADDGPVLQLQREDGKVIRVPYRLFGKEDQQFSVNWYQQQKSQPQGKVAAQTEKEPREDPAATGASVDTSQISMPGVSRTSKRRLPRVGDRVQIEYGGRWWDGELVEAKDGKYKFRYDGYSSTWDEWKTKEQLRWEDGSAVVAGSAADPNASDVNVAKRDSSTSKAVAKNDVTKGEDATIEPSDAAPMDRSATAAASAKNAENVNGIAGNRKAPGVGDRVQIKWGSSWWKGEIVERDGKRFRFRYDGYGETSDEWKTIEHLRWEDGTPVIKGGPADPETAKLAASEMKAEKAAIDSKQPTPTIVIDQSLLAPAKVAWDESDVSTTSDFPKGMSPEETLEYLKTQAMVGNLQAFWNWIPDEVRTYVTSDEQRANLVILDEVNVRGLGPGHFLVELVAVMKTKKEFVLKSPITRLLLEDQSSIEMFAEIYEPSVAFFNSVTQLIANVDDEIRTAGFDSKIRDHCDQIGLHLSELLRSAPESVLEEFWNRFRVDSGPNGNFLTLVYPTGESKRMSLTRVNGRWIPKPLAESLLSIPDAQRKKVKEIRTLSQSRKDGRAMGAGMAQGIKDANYMSLAEKLRAAASAKTQAEFDAAMQNVLIALQTGGWLG